MAEPIRIAVLIEGGLIHEVYTAGIPVEYVIVDYDTDGREAVSIDGENCVVSVYNAASSEFVSRFVEQAFQLATE